MSSEGSSHHPDAMQALEDFTMLAVDFRPPTEALPEGEAVVKEKDPTQITKLPKSSLLVIADEELVHGHHHHKHRRGTLSFGSLSEIDFEFSKVKVRNWNRTKFYADYIREGLEYTKRVPEAVMLFEAEGAKMNKDKFKFLNWPPEKPQQPGQAPSVAKGTLGPLRYAAMSGSALPVFYRHGNPPKGLTDHWADTIPGYVPTRFVNQVDEKDCIYAYLPVEKIENHVNDPAVHYHLAGKDSIHLMTQKTTKLLPDTRTVRPCVVKTTHSMGSKGIFIIANDEDEKEFEQFLKEAGNPTFVVTDFVDIQRNVACHFFMHPDGERVVWFGSNENKRMPNGHFSSDSYIYMKDQEDLKHMQLPFVDEVVQYCKSLGFWGFCGIDVLFDSKGNGHLVDINPRVTGSCPALMTLQILHKKYGFDSCLFRRSGDITFPGPAEEMWKQVKAYNDANKEKSAVVIHSMYESKGHCRINVGVYGTDMDACTEALNQFAKPDH